MIKPPTVVFGIVFVYLTDEVSLGLVLNSNCDVQSAHSIEEIVRVHGLGHTSLLEELWTNSHWHLRTENPHIHAARDQSGCYRGNIPAIPEEELQTVRMSGLHRLTDVDQPDLQHKQHLSIHLIGLCLPLVVAAVTTPPLRWLVYQTKDRLQADRRCAGSCQNSFYNCFFCEY